MTKLPVAVVVAPACARTTGTTTSRAAPLIASLPTTSKRPGPLGLTLVDWKTACGNCLMLNQSGLASSASVSATPRATLARSMVSAIFAASGFFGSNASCASNLRKRPSTGTPICLLVKAISLFAATSCWAETGSAVAANSARAEAAKVGFMRAFIGVVIEDSGAARPYPRQRGVAIDEVVLQCGADVGEHQQRHHPGEPLVPGLDRLGQRLVDRHEVGQR